MCEVRPLAVRSASLAEGRGFEPPVLFVVLTFTKGLELRTAYEHRMAESERAVRCVQPGFAPGRVRALLALPLRIAAGQLSWAAGIAETCSGSRSFL